MAIDRNISTILVFPDDGSRRKFSEISRFKISLYEIQSVLREKIL